MEALGAVCQLGPDIEAPTWLTPRRERPQAEELVACGNGLLHLPTGDLYASTPEFFGLSASDVQYDPNAPAPRQWLKFLQELFGKDQEAINLLQDWFGYALSPDASLQKILLLIGPKRSGKGTIARILTWVLGRRSVAGPTMSSLAEPFGLEPLIASPLAIVSDARIGPRTDKSAIAERLLSVSGEDQISVRRKFKQAWTGRLPTRFMIITNELPNLGDGSGALAGRFLLLLLSNCYFGREDPGLTEKLLQELPGILNWSIEGYRRLQERRRFVQPRSAQEALDDIEALSSPVKAFIRETCIVGQGRTVASDTLWEAWRCWSEQEGRRDAGTRVWFGRNLLSAEPGITQSKPGRGDERCRTYVGITLKPGAERPL